jgi:hypothetical protein
MDNVDVSGNDATGSIEAAASPEVGSNLGSTSVASDATPSTDNQASEKLVPQHVVDKVVGTRVKEAYERAKRDAIAEMQKTSQPANHTESMGGMTQLSPEQLEQKIQEVAWKMSQQAVANKIAQDFEGKIEAAKKDDPQFDEAYRKLNLERHPELILWTNGLDNTAKVIKDIADNPTKLSQILMLAQSGFPQLAQQELTKLSASIKANEAAQKQPEANEPLSQIKPSNVGVDNGAMTVSDFRKIFRGY